MGQLGLWWRVGLLAASCLPRFPVLRQHMSQIAPADKLQQLDQRHTLLIEELDALNLRLEQTLGSLSAASEPGAESAELEA